MNRLINFPCFFLLSAFTFGDCVEVTRGAKLKVSWEIPTTRANGNSLALSELDHYTIYWTCDTPPIKAGQQDISPARLVETTLASDAMLGACHFAMSAVDTGGNKSALSQSVCVLVKLPKPAEGGFR